MAYMDDPIWVFLQDSYSKFLRGPQTLVTLSIFETELVTFLESHRDAVKDWRYPSYTYPNFNIVIGDGTMLHVAVKFNMLMLAEFCLVHHVPIDHVNIGHCTALYVASLNRRWEMAELLHRYGANRNIADSRGRLPEFYHSIPLEKKSAL